VLEIQGKPIPEDIWTETAHIAIQMGGGEH